MYTEKLSTLYFCVLHTPGAYTKRFIDLSNALDGKSLLQILNAKPWEAAHDRPCRFLSSGAYLLTQTLAAATLSNVYKNAKSVGMPYDAPVSFEVENEYFTFFQSDCADSAKKFLAEILLRCHYNIGETFPGRLLVSPQLCYAKVLYTMNKVQTFQDESIAEKAIYSAQIQLRCKKKACSIGVIAILARQDNLAGSKVVPSNWEQVTSNHLNYYLLPSAGTSRSDYLRVFQTVKVVDLPVACDFSSMSSEIIHYRQ